MPIVKSRLKFHQSSICLNNLVLNAQDFFVINIFIIIIIEILNYCIKTKKSIILRITFLKYFYSPLGNIKKRREGKTEQISNHWQK